MKIMDDKELKDLITDNKVADTVPCRIHQNQVEHQRSLRWP
jgi:hypothetical protein